MGCAGCVACVLDTVTPGIPSPTELFPSRLPQRLPTIAPYARGPTNPEIGYITRYRLQFYLRTKLSKNGKKN